MKIILNIILLVIIASGIMVLQGCGDDDKPKSELEKLPAATQEGKGTFGCLMNGKAWVVKSFTNAPTFYQEGVLQIVAHVTTPKIDQVMSIILYEDNLTVAQYILNEYPEKVGLVEDLAANCEYLTSTVYQGSLTITNFDQTNFIISGTFEFEAYSDDCSKSVKVTHGRFDLHYAP